MGPEIGRRGEDACERPQKEGQSQTHYSSLGPDAQPLFQDCCRTGRCLSESKRERFRKNYFAITPNRDDAAVVRWIACQFQAW